MGRRRRRQKRRPEGRARGRDARPGRFVNVRVDRSPKGRRKSAKVTKRRRRNGNVTEDSYEL